MTMLSKSSSYENVAEPFHCDFSGRIFVGHLANHLLNAADCHSTERGYGMRQLHERGCTWVLSRLVIEMNEMPLSGRHFMVETWVENVMRYFTYRNFAVRDADSDEVYGYGRSVWAMIDVETRQPTDILAVDDGMIVKYADRDKPCPVDAFRRVRFKKKLKAVLEVQTGYTDVDVNGHVNSVKYIEQMLDAIPIDYYQHHRLHRIDIAYMAECHGGDCLKIYLEAQTEGEFGFSLRRTNADGTETEASVARLCFVESEE